MVGLLKSIGRLVWYWLANLILGGCKAALGGGRFLVSTILIAGVAWFLCWIFLC
jgi:hypothetical protein